MESTRTNSRSATRPSRIGPAGPHRATAHQARWLRALHAGPKPLLLPCAWDVASAQRLEAAGFMAIGTTSAGIAASHGFADGQQMPVGLMLEAIARIARAVAVPVSADLEAGYGLAPDELVVAALNAEVAGLNLEDSDAETGALADPVAQADRLAAVKDQALHYGVDLVLNARIDSHLVGDGTPEDQLADGLERARLYRMAGADCVFPICADRESEIASYVRRGFPVNVLARWAAPSIGRLRTLGVRRISFGEQLMRENLAALSHSAARLLAQA